MNNVAKLLAVKLFEDDRLTAKVVVKPNPGLNVAHIRYEISDSKEFTGHVFTFHEQPCVPIKLTIPRGVRSPGFAARAEVVYTDGQVEHTETIYLDNAIPTKSNYLDPKQVFKDKDNRAYTISISAPYHAYTKPVTWHEASEYLQYKNETDRNWSLPNREEIGLIYDLFSLGICEVEEGSYWLDEEDKTNSNFNKVMDIKEGRCQTMGKNSKAFFRPIIRNYLEVIKEPVEQLPMQGIPCEEYYDCEDLVKEHFESLEDHSPIVIEELLRVAAMLGEQDQVSFIDNLAAGNLQALAQVIEEGFIVVPKIDIK